MAVQLNNFTREDLYRSRAHLLRLVQMDGVTDLDVLRALRLVPRHLLVPPQLIAASYQNRALPIGSEQTISQPTIVGLMSQWAIEGAQPSQRQRVLEVGTGSGYQAAVLAELFDEVYTVEVRPDLAERARNALIQVAPRADRIRCLVGDGTLGLPEASPFDAIVVTAAAKRIPPAFLEQLRPAGRLVMPLSTDDGHQRLHLFRCVENDGVRRLETERSMPVLFVPLVDIATQ